MMERKVVRVGLDQAQDDTNKSAKLKDINVKEAAVLSSVRALLRSGVDRSSISAQDSQQGEDEQKRSLACSPVLFSGNCRKVGRSAKLTHRSRCSTAT